MENFLKDSWFTTIFTGKTTEGDKISATTMNVTKIVTFFVTLFAGLTQIIKLTADKFPITAGQMVAIWLVVATLVVFLVIADMATRAYVTAHTPPPAAREPDTSRQGAAQRKTDALPASEQHVHVRFDSDGGGFETYVEPELVIR
jgi:hypothetical protein